MADVIKPTFGGSSGGGSTPPPPPTPPTYDELMFTCESQRELIAHLRRLVIDSTKEKARLNEVTSLLVRQMAELLKLVELNQTVVAQAQKNILACKAIIDTTP